MAELMAVIAQSQRRLQRIGQGGEAAEMADPFRICELIQPDTGGMAVIAEAQQGLRKIGRCHKIEKTIPQRPVVGGRPIER